MKTVYQLYLDELSTLFKALLTLIEDDEIEKAIDLTKKLLQALSIEDLSNLSSISSNLKRVNREYNAQSISFEEYSRLRNQSIRAVLDFIQPFSSAIEGINDFSQYAKLLQPHSSILDILADKKAGRESTKPNRLGKVILLHNAL